jgi:hypothetical protein
MNGSIKFLFLYFTKIKVLFNYVFIYLYFI